MILSDTLVLFADATSDGNLWVAVGCAVVVACLFAGFLLGVRSERESWLARGDQDPRFGRTAHHCNGKFYYVVPEAEMVSRQSLGCETLTKMPTTPPPPVVPTGSEI